MIHLNKVNGDNHKNIYTVDIRENVIPKLNIFVTNIALVAS